MLKACLLKAEVVRALGDTVQVAGVDGEIHTNAEGLSLRGGRLSRSGRSGRLCSNGSLGGSGSGSGSGCRLVGMVALKLIIFVMFNLFGMNFLDIIEKAVVVVDNDGLMSINVLDDSEWVKLDLVGDLVLAGDQDTVVENLDEVMEVLLDLNLVPVNTDASI